MTAEKEYSINFTKQQNKFCLSLHYNGLNSYLFINGVEIYKFKAKASEINVGPLCLNVSQEFSANMKKTGLHKYVYHFSVDYNNINVANTLDNHKYLMVKNNTK